MKPRFEDHFSRQSGSYAASRPDYPATLFRYLAGIAPAHDRAWDCATGNGQAAVALAPHFHEVIATDASAQQLSHAPRRSGIAYRVAGAEESGIETGSVDLVTVAQALHWFDRERFYAEVAGVLKPGGVLAVWSYNLLQISPELDRLIGRLYGDIVGGYWPAQRRLVEDGYRSLDLPFPELSPPAFEMVAHWSLGRLMSYLGSWSAVQRYKDAKGPDPVALIADRLRAAWGSEEHRAVRWPLALRVGIRP
ncbi:MAG TPA: class I SAM-dependent methyltransferase [Gammaproteobacteria bacterium]|nr:class I SAM-dependent methyltransferase [Gammaproteobacteria bacterium]